MLTNVLHVGSNGCVGGHRPNKHSSLAAMRQRNTADSAAPITASHTPSIIGKIPFLLSYLFNTLRPRQNRHRRHFADDIFKGIFLNENVWIPIKFSLKFVPKGPINNIPALVQIMAWRRPGDKALSEQMVVSLLTHICVTRTQWV